MVPVALEILELNGVMRKHRCNIGRQTCYPVVEHESVWGNWLTGGRLPAISAQDWCIGDMEENWTVGGLASWWPLWWKMGVSVAVAVVDWRIRGVEGGTAS